MPISTGDRVPSTEKWVGKQIERATAAGQAWVDGVKNPKKDPVKAAIAAKGKWKDSMQRAIQEDRFAKSLAQVDSQVIADTVDALGSTPFVNGIQAREPKIRARVEKLRTKVVEHVSKMDSMPTDTLEQRKAKMLANLDGMISIGKSMKGG